MAATIPGSPTALETNSVLSLHIFCGMEFRHKAIREFEMFDV